MIVVQSCLTLCSLMDCSLTGSSVHGNSPGKNPGVSCSPPGDVPNPGIKPRTPTLQVDSLLSEPPGKSNSAKDLVSSFPSKYKHPRTNKGHTSGEWIWLRSRDECGPGSWQNLPFITPSHGVFAHMITGCLLEWGPGLSKRRHTHNPVCPNTQIFTESFESGDLHRCV